MNILIYYSVEYFLCSFDYFFKNIMIILNQEKLELFFLSSSSLKSQQDFSKNYCHHVTNVKQFISFIYYFLVVSIIYSF